MYWFINNVCVFVSILLCFLVVKVEEKRFRVVLPTILPQIIEIVAVQNNNIVWHKTKKKMNFKPII